MLDFDFELSDRLQKSNKSPKNTIWNKTDISLSVVGKILQFYITLLIWHCQKTKSPVYIQIQGLTFWI